MISGRFFEEAQPPSGGCVLKQNVFVFERTATASSRLRAAVC